MADESATGAPGKLNLAALGVAATGLVTVLGGLSLTGTVGRVLRNNPEEIAWALSAVLVGAALLAAAGLPATGKPVEVVFSLIGLELTLAGLVIAGVTGVKSAGNGERPAISAQLVAEGTRVKGRIVAGNLSSDDRFVALVSGISMPPNSKEESSVPLQRADIGPDGDGKVDFSFDTRIPAGRYTEVRIAGWSINDTTQGSADAEPDSSQMPTPADTACDKGETRPRFALKRKLAGTGCVSLPLALTPLAPRVEAHWIGTKTDTQRLAINLATNGAPDAQDTRVALVVKRKQADGKYFRLYRAVLVPDGSGKLANKVEVPVPPGARRVCVGAAFVSNKAFPSFPCTGSTSELKNPQQTVIHLRQPPVASKASGTAAGS
jgi:hypothetical protein